MRSIVRILILFLFFVSPVSSTTWYLSPEGNDAWSGRLEAPSPDGKDGPFATFERGLAAMNGQALAGGSNDDLILLVRGGTYFRSNPIQIGALTGIEIPPARVIRAYAGEKVSITGGNSIGSFKVVEDVDVLSRIPEEAHGKVYQSDLFAQGITDFGVMKERGFGRPVRPAGLELFFNDEPMQIARWPNEDYATIADIPEDATEGRFNYGGGRPERWGQAEDLWLHGLWTWDWADSYTRVQKIDTLNKEFITYPPHGIYGYKKDRRYYALNLLEELDQPGEWYLDRLAGILYFWPPSDLSKGKTVVSIGERLLEMKGTSGVTLEGMALEVTRGTAVRVSGGQGNQLVDCVIRNIGNTGIRIDGGKENRISGCEVYNTGDGGISLSGGDRRTLESAGNEVVDCHIHHYSRWSKTYRPAVWINGVGNRVAHNHIHHAPHNAIQLGGNEHLIEFNEIHHVCQETSDVGAFYMGRDWTQRGNKIRHNFFHHLGGFEGREDAFSHAIAIYLDDWSSGTEIYGNVVYRGGYGVLVGGGRNNQVKNNVFVDCKPAIQVDSRGLGWAKYYFNGDNTTLIDRLDAMDYKEPPYSERYPELLTLYEDEPDIAKYNQIHNNIAVGGEWIHLRNGLDEEVVEFKDNLLDEDPLFVDRENLNFQLKEDSPAYKLGFEKIPFEIIGNRE